MMPSLRPVLLLLLCCCSFATFSQPFVALGNDTTLCVGSSFLLVPTVSGNGLTYLWQNGHTLSSIVVDTAGWYWLEVSDGTGIARDSVHIDLRYPPAPVDLGPDTLLCPGDTILLDATQPGGFYFWQNNSASPTQAVTQPGIYGVIVSNICGMRTDTVQIEAQLPPAPFLLGSDTLLCQGNMLTLQMGQGDPALQYLWQNGATDSNLTVSVGGLYTLSLSNQCGTERDSMEVRYLAPPQAFSLGRDTVACQGDSLLLRHVQADVQYRWQNNQTDSQLLATQTGNYHLTLSNFCGVEQDTIYLDFLKIPEAFDLGPDTTLCEGQGLRLSIAQEDARYLWSDSSQLAAYTANQLGWHWGMAYNQCGSERDSVYVEILLRPDPFVLGKDTTICAGTSLELSARQPEGTYLWSTGDTSASIIVQEQNVYWVEVSNRCGLELDNIFIAYLDPPHPFSLGPDTTICWETPLVLDASIGQPPARYRWQDGSTDSVFWAYQAMTYAVFLENKCGYAADTIAVDTLTTPPLVDLGADTTYCMEDLPFIAQVRVSRPDIRLLWDNGDQIPLRWVRDTGRLELELVNRCGSTLSARYISGADCACTVYMGNAFTPNHDGHNDLFGPIHDCEIRAFRFAIYNRWGVRVYQSNVPDQLWDGTQQGIPCPEGVYGWVLEYTGAELDRIFTISRRGSVTLLR